MVLSAVDSDEDADLFLEKKLVQSRAQPKVLIILLTVKNDIKVCSFRNEICLYLQKKMEKHPGIE